MSGPRLAICCLLLLQGLPAHGQAPLTRAADVRSLPVERAMTGVPVQLQASVGFIEAPGTIFVQDGTGGTFFRTKADLGGLQLGDVVAIRGVTVPGLYLTGIESTEFTIVGHGPPPAPQPATYDDLAAGRFHYQKVLVEGIGRRLSALEENRALLHLALDRRVIEVRIDAPPAGLEVVDARLRITALAAGGINDRRQLVFPYLRVSDWNDVMVVERAQAVTGLAPTPAARLLRFGSLDESAHRVRVRGVVLASFMDGRLFVRDASPAESSPAAPAAPTAEPAAPAPAPTPVAVAIRLVTPAAFTPGQVVDVAGFPSMESFSASLADAEVIEVVNGPAEVSADPIPVTAATLLSGSHDADLVTLPMTLLDVLRSADGIELRLAAEDTALTAVLPSIQPPTAWLPGARLQVTGVCLIESASDKGFRSRPERARLLLRDLGDVRVLQAPSWWTARRLMIAVGVLVAAVVLALVWIGALRRQVERQAQALRRRIAFEAALEERQRIAREFHDTLEQELAGLSIRLDAAVTRPLEEKARGLLDASRHLVARIQAEARNLVADLRSTPEAVEADLPASLQALIDRLQFHDSLSVSLDLRTALPPLAAHVVHHLRMIAQEAVTNAMKHAQAGRIRLELACADNVLTLEVIDDGRGFDPQIETAGKPGHFGCMGIRERCRKIGAQAQWQSAPGAGTTLRITLPI